jgi:hypothetical protein
LRLHDICIAAPATSGRIAPPAKTERAAELNLFFFPPTPAVLRQSNQFATGLSGSVSSMPGIAVVLPSSIHFRTVRAPAR